MDKRRGAANSEGSAVPGVELISVAKERHGAVTICNGVAWRGLRSKGKAKNGAETRMKGNETKGPEKPWNGKATRRKSEGKEKPSTEKYNKNIKRRINMTINEFLLKTFVPEDPKLKKIHDDFGFSKEDRVLPKRPRVECADGFTFSAQAGSALYCTPRVTLYPETWGDGYQEIELGYPSAHDELIDEYAEMSEYDSYTETVYGYVPVEVVDQLIAKHGGIAGEDTSNVELPDLPGYLKLKFNRFMDAYDSLCKIRYEEMHNEDKSNIPESHSKLFGYGYFLKMTHWHEWELSKLKHPANEVLATCVIKNEPDIMAELVSAYIYDETENWMTWTIANESKEETEDGNDNEDSEHSGRYSWGD